MTPPPTETVVWVADEVQAYAEGFGETCKPQAVEGLLLPKGLRGVAKPARDACGKDWLWVRFDVPGFPPNRPAAWYVPAKAVATKAPAAAWDKAPAKGSAWIRRGGDRPTLAVPLDNPGWTSPALLSEGEVVERLAPRVVRTASGHEVWIDDFFLVDTDPLAESRSSQDGERVANRRRFHAGRPLHEKVAPLAVLPPSDELKSAPKGQAFAFKVELAWLSAPTYAPGWFDPVGHTLTHTCAPARALEPCGTYTLDYRALGAWVPPMSADAIAVWNGSALEVQVLWPWSDKIGVTPAWDGRPDPTAATP